MKISLNTYTRENKIDLQNKFIAIGDLSWTNGTKL